MGDISRVDAVGPIAKKVFESSSLSVDEQSALVGLLYTVASSADYLERLGDSGQADDVRATMWSAVEKVFTEEFLVEPNRPPRPTATAPQALPEGA